LKQAAAVISIAGADPGQGAGLQMDQRVCERLEVNFVPVVALDTEQDEAGLRALNLRDADQVAEDLQQAIDQAQAAGHSVAIKTGALGSAAIVARVVAILAKFPALPLVVDPVRLASRSHHPDLCLLTDLGWQTAKTELWPRATLLTPNALEFGTGADFQGCAAVLCKGGHRSDLAAPSDQSDQSAQPDQSDQAGQSSQAGSTESPSPCSACTPIEDRLLRPGLGEKIYRAERLPGATEIHGTGCALSTAISCFLAKGAALPEAIAYARDHLQNWLKEAIELDSGRLLAADR